MAKREKISISVIRRLPRYYRFLGLLASHGVTRISSKDLADKMELTIRQTSNMIAGLRDRGLVYWSHDGNGSDGTYVTITDIGRQNLYEQEDILKDFYGRVIEKYGKQNLIELLRLMKQLDTVMNGEMEVMNDNDREKGMDI